MKIELPFELGVQVWKATLHYREVREVCPECNGNKVVVVTQGNGEAFELPCKGCEVDVLTPPCGYVTHQESDYIPLSFIPKRWGIYGQDAWYSESSPDASSWTQTDAKDLFSDFMECIHRCNALNVERDVELKKREYQHLMHKRQDYAWSVHYWRNQRNKLRKDLGWVEARLVQIKERTK
jgi:hypothetical protein